VGGRGDRLGLGVMLRGDVEEGLVFYAYVYVYMYVFGDIVTYNFSQAAASITRF